MTLEFFFIESKTAMLLQEDIWTDISTFLHLLLDPIFFVLQDEGLRRTLFSTVIWSFLIVCGLVYVVYEIPSVLKLILGPPKQSIVKQNKTSEDGRLQAATESASRHQISREKSQKEREKREAAVKQTGVTVATKIVRDRELLRLSVTITNASNSHINMVVVDLDLPSGIDAETGSFRMQRLGTINASETKSVDFILRPTGGELADIGGYVEFLGASYEVSKIALPVPDMEGMFNE
ncbi:MAG: hypothetical protein E4H14_15710 [Candidatus Thorarchaeota archaeon]|nr:MAG: hypothetical protein E4H14_15710 [Candidatus Thorarchaeota archaeon]